MFVLLSSDPKNISTTTTLKDMQTKNTEGLYINVDSFKLISNCTQSKLTLIMLSTMRNSTCDRKYNFNCCLSYWSKECILPHPI